MEIPRQADVQVQANLTAYLNAAEANRWVRAFREHRGWGQLWTRESLKRGCPVRVELEHVMVFGTVQEARSLVRAKTRWGRFLRVAPLQPDDEIDPTRIVYQHKPSSLCRQRYENRMTLKRVLGKEGRGLVSQAMRLTKGVFVLRVTQEETALLWERLGVSAGGFWRLCRRGTGWVQTEFPLSDRSDRLPLTELDLYRQTLRQRRGQTGCLLGHGGLACVVNWS